MLLGELRNGTRRERMDQYKNDILAGVDATMFGFLDREDNRKFKELQDNKGNRRSGVSRGGGLTRYDDYKKQQREIERFMKLGMQTSIHIL